MSDDPSLGELGRRIEALHQAVREGDAQLNARLDRMVSAEVYAIEKAVNEQRDKDLLDRLKAVEQARKVDADRRAADRRLIFTALVAPVLLLLLNVYLNAKGAGS